MELIDTIKLLNSIEMHKTICPFCNPALKAFRPEIDSEINIYESCACGSYKTCHCVEEEGAAPPSVALEAK